MFLEVLQDILYVFGCSYVGSIYIYNVYVFLMDCSLEYYEVTFWVSFYGSFFWSLFCPIWVLLPRLFFPCPFAWNICFQPFMFSLCKSFVLRWVSCRQHMCWSCFLIHFGTLYLLIRAFNPVMFKVIIDTYLFIAILLPLYLCSSLSLTLFLPFLKAVPLASLAELV